MKHLTPNHPEPEPLPNILSIDYPAFVCIILMVQESLPNEEVRFAAKWL